ncbi:MAG: hypothetical protein E7007_04440 [Alphaproteobacteria bacterium]|nr:hypothetical protein [Alphaproteobacteria bacterium]
MKKIISVLLALIVAPAYSATTPAPRVSIFSTSTDWQAVTGLTLNEYSGKFISDKKLVGRGLVLYYLDGFPCYGLGFGVRVWIGPDGKSDNDLAIACVAAPTEIKFAYRNATRNADQATTTGILTCPVSDRGRDLTIDLSDCIVGPDWDEYK